MKKQMVNNYLSKVFRLPELKVYDVPMTDISNLLQIDLQTLDSILSKLFISEAYTGSLNRATNIVTIIK